MIGFAFIKPAVIPAGGCRNRKDTPALILALVIGSLWSGGVGASPSDDRAGPAAPATGEEIASRIIELSDPSYAVRTAAMRRLCAIGLPARAQLGEAARSADPEAALRAEKLMVMLDRLWFAGIEVSLACSRSRVAWDDPVDLLVTFTNRSSYTGYVPFDIGAARDHEAGDARQVGDMLDLAEVLKVRGPEGNPVELQVDDIMADPAVEAVVEQRVEGGPRHPVGPGETFTIAIRDFNRGWARYRLLDPGEYRAMVEYVPLWEDQALREGQVGRVVSNEVALMVTRGAPPSVSRDSREASVELERRGPLLVATLTNLTDQPMFVNKNFGPAAPFALGHWVYTLDDSIRELSVLPPEQITWENFSRLLIEKVGAGESVELARFAVEDLRDRLVRAGADLSTDRWTVNFSYLNSYNRQWERRHPLAVPPGKTQADVPQEALPRRILSTRQASNRLQAPN
ncbi:MAG: hypothetical protein KJ749_00080 [Planctomycetes bacterium]|nr:hypothetical protein [Planctomycetota bacterium]